MFCIQVRQTDAIHKKYELSTAKPNWFRRGRVLKQTLCRHDIHVVTCYGDLYTYGYIQEFNVVSIYGCFHDVLLE